jgi:hypothetical protein
MTTSTDPRYKAAPSPRRQERAAAEALADLAVREALRVAAAARVAGRDEAAEALDAAAEALFAAALVAAGGDASHQGWSAPLDAAVDEALDRAWAARRGMARDDREWDVCRWALVTALVAGCDGTATTEDLDEADDAFESLVSWVAGDDGETEDDEARAEAAYVLEVGVEAYWPEFKARVDAGVPPLSAAEDAPPEAVEAMQGAIRQTETGYTAKGQTEAIGCLLTWEAEPQDGALERAGGPDEPTAFRSWDGLLADLNDWLASQWRDDWEPGLSDEERRALETDGEVTISRIGLWVRVLTVTVRD